MTSETFKPELLRRIGEVVKVGDDLPTLSHKSANLILGIDQHGMDVKTPEAAQKGTPRRVPAALFNLAWDELCRTGQVSRPILIDRVGAGRAKRTSAVLAVLERLPEVGLVRTAPTIILEQIKA